MMEMLAFLDIYATYRAIRPATKQQYAWVLLDFSSFVGRAATTADLTPDIVNAWLEDLSETLSPHTVKSRRMTLLSLWRLAAEMGHCEAPRQIRPAKVPALIIDTLTAKQAEEVLRICQHLPGHMAGVLKALYMWAMVKATLETSLRQSDLHRLLWDDVRHSGGQLQIVQQKTGMRRWVLFSAALLAQLSTWHAPPKLVFPRGRRVGVTETLREIGQELQLPYHLTHTVLRKTAITDVEQQHPGAGWIFAGHASPDTTRRWYTDADRAYRDLPRPRF